MWFECLFFAEPDTYLKDLDFLLRNHITHINSNKQIVGVRKENVPKKLLDKLLANHLEPEKMDVYAFTGLVLHSISENHVKFSYELVNTDKLNPHSKARKRH